MKRPASEAPLSRRSFIRQSTAAAAGTALLPAVLPHVHASVDDEIKIALIGCGGRGTGACVQALSTAGPVKLWAMADAFPDQLEKSYKSLVAGTRKFSQSPDAGSQAAKVNVPPERRFVGLDAYKQVMALSEVDVVLMTTPPGFRPVQFAAAVKAGKHVFMEKPVATDPHGIRTVLEAAKLAKRKNLKVGVGLNRRHSPLYRETVNRIHDGAIGRLNAIRIYNLRGGTGKYHERRPGETELEYQVRHWYYFAWLSGDFNVEQSVHDYDIALWMKDMLPISAQGQGGRLVRNGKDYGNVYDHFFIEYDFPDGSKMQTQHRHIPRCWGTFSSHADGSKGTANLVAKRIGEIQLHDADKPLWRGKETGNSYQIEHDVLFNAIRNNLSHNEAERGANASFAAILGRMAAYSGQQLKWDDVLESNERITPEGEMWESPAPIEPLPSGGYLIPTPANSRIA